MPKFPTFPNLYDDALQIHIGKLKKWGYLEPDSIRSSTLTWSTNGNQIGQISIEVYTNVEQPYIQLKYNYKNEPRNYKVNLVSIPSNLGKGKIWYFLCPQTNKRCRKLYSIGGYFLHREAFTGCMYESQVRSKHYRHIDKMYGAYFKKEKHYEKLHSKNFKKFYAGKPTKSYLRIMEQINEADQIPFEQIERLMVFGK